MLSCTRITEAEELATNGLWAEYEAAFPRSERRSAAQHARAMALEADFHCMQCCDGDKIVGLLFYWQMPHCVYVEHFAICAACRGRGYGRLVLQWLQQQGLPIILEIEPPECPATRRRQRFYESAGFVPQPYPHIQPAYHADTEPLPMLLMGWPGVIAADAVAAFERNLHERVMSYTDR